MQKWELYRIKSYRNGSKKQIVLHLVGGARERGRERERTVLKWIGASRPQEVKLWFICMSAGFVCGAQFHRGRWQTAPCICSAHLSNFNFARIVESKFFRICPPFLCCFSAIHSVGTICPLNIYMLWWFSNYTEL